MKKLLFSTFLLMFLCMGIKAEAMTLYPVTYYYGTMDKDKTFDATKNGSAVSVTYKEGDKVVIADGYDEDGTRRIFTDYQSSDTLKYQITKSTKEKLIKHMGVPTSFYSTTPVRVEE